MLLNHIKVAIRNISRSLSYPIINVAGLTLGITCAVVIFALVTYHLSFDTFHNNTDRTYRFVTEQHRGEVVSYVPSVPPAFGNAFRNDYSYAEKVARVLNTDETIAFEAGGEQKKFYESLSFADPEFFEMFNFPLVTSHSSVILDKPNTAILTEKMADKFFGKESAIGKTLRIGTKLEFTIIGVLKDLPDNTDFRSEIYFSYSTMPQYNEWVAAEDSWGGIASDVQTFGLLHAGVSIDEIEAKLPDYVKKYRAESKNVHHYKLQPLTDIHFNALYRGGMSMRTIWILAVIGFFLIITACLNFVNLATAQAIRRAKEVGVRKALGSAKGQLFWQFTIETGLIVTVAAILAIGSAWTAMPYLNELFQTRASIAFTDIRLIAFVIGLIASVTLLAGSYPGIVLSQFKPVQALKGKVTSASGGGLNLRRILITSQFVISHILLIGLIVVMTQLKFFMEADMGFQKDGVVMISLGSSDTKMNTLKEQFRQIPGVENVSVCFAAPASNQFWGTSVFFDNAVEQETFGPSFKGADADYLATFGIDLITGRNLTPSDTAREFLVNETFVKKLNLTPDAVIGKTLTYNNGVNKGPIVGVVSDFHDRSFHSVINPIFITTDSENYNEYAIRINMASASTLLPQLEKAWTQMYPDKIYNYEFLDDQTANFYQAEELILKLVQTFAFIALFIGCLGLYGLVSFMVVQKTKEIGIRKVLGGSIPHILWIFGKEFVVLVIAAFAIAAPTAVYLTSKWLEGYEYKTGLTVWVFIIEFAIVSAFVLFTVGFRSARAALANPVNSLRTE